MKNEEVLKQLSEIKTAQGVVLSRLDDVRAEQKDMRQDIREMRSFQDEQRGRAKIALMSVSGITGLIVAAVEWIFHHVHS